MSDASVRQHPDLFTPDEAAAYLHLESVRGLDTLRSDFGLVGYTGVGKSFLYWREDLDNVALRIVGRKPSSGSQQKPMRMAR
jgi:hypothetical protein